MWCDLLLYLVKKFRDDFDSFFINKIYDGGKFDVIKFIFLRIIKMGLEYMFLWLIRLIFFDDIDV